VHKRTYLFTTTEAKTCALVVLYEGGTGRCVELLVVDVLEDFEHLRLRQTEQPNIEPI